MSLIRPRFRRRPQRLNLERLEVRLSPAVLSLRTGLGAAMVADAGISAAAPNSPQGSAAAIGVEAGATGPTRQGLLRFESLFGPGAQQIPLGSTIVSASLSIWVGNGASSATPIQLHRMLVPWSASLATWNSFNGNGTPGIQTDGVEALATADGNAGAATGTGYRVIGGLASALQAWASGASNNGWVLTVPGTSTGWSFDASESANTAHRPTLTIQYVPSTTAAFPTYVDLAGAPPVVTQSEWFDWQTDLETQRLNRVPSARTHTYYFAQNGNDTTGTGEMNSPWKTLAHAQSILNASSGDVRLRFRRGDIWREATTLQIGRESVTVDAYGDANLDAPLFSRFTRTYTSGWTFNAAEGLWSRSEANPVGWLRTVNNPDTTILYRAAFKAEAAARPGSWLYDHVAGRLYLSSITDPNALVGGFEANLADAIGWTVTSDDVRLEDLRIQGAGMATTGKGNGLEILQPPGAEFVGIRVAVTWAGGAGIRVAGGAAAATLIGCSAGWLENRGGTGLSGSGDVYPFEINSGNGGHELMLRDCTVVGGALPSADWNGRAGARHGRHGVFQYNNGPTMPPALSIALRTKYPDRGWQVAGGTHVFGPTVSELAGVRAYIVGESPADGIDSRPGSGSSDRAYVNNVYTHLAAGRPVGRPFALYAGGTYGSWVINTTVRVDATQLAQAKLYSWYQSASPIDVRIENSRFEITGLDTRSFEFLLSGAGPNFRIRNSVLIADGSQSTSLGPALGPGRLDHNAYAFSSALPGLATVDPAGVILQSPPTIDHVPTPDDDPLHGGGVLTGLEYDQFGQARPTNRNDIGPIVGVTANPANRNLPYHQLPGVGQPPSPDDPAWFDWEERLRATRLANVPLSRSTTYHFAQSGDDMTGDGSAANPFRTLAWANGLLSTSYSAFSGGGSILLAPDLPAFQPNGKDFTIAFWGDFTNTSFSVVAAKTGSWTMGYLDNQHFGIRLLDANQATVAQVLWPTVLSSGWHYYVAGYDAAEDRLRLSIDGSPAISVVSSADPIAGTAPLRLLAGTVGAVGRVDDAAYWTSAPGGGGALSDASIAQLYAAGRGRRFEEVPPAMRPSMTAWWQFDEPGNAAIYADRLGVAALSRQGAGLQQMLGYQTGPADLRLRFRGGDTWRDNTSLLVSRSQVTIDSYGAGIPTFTRFTQMYSGGWTLVSGNLWRRAESVNIAWVRPAADPLGTIYKSELSSATTAGYSFSFFHDLTGTDPNSGGVPTLYLNPGPGVNPNLVAGGFEAARPGNGWGVEADNVRMQNLRVHGFGLDRAGGGNPGYGLYVSHHGFVRAEFVGIGLEFYFTGYHSIGHLAQNSGSMTLVDCRVGLCVVAATAGSEATPFVSFANDGGQELIMADNEVSYGGLPSWDWNAQPGGRRGSYGIFQHTAGGPTFPSLSIALRTRFPDNPWQVVNSTRVYAASAANLAGVRAYVIGEAPADGISSQPGFGVFDCAYVNNVYEHMIRRPNTNSVALYYGPISSWVINTTVRVDARDWLFSFAGHAIYFGNGTTTNAQLINSRFEVINNNIEDFYLIQPFNSPVGANFLLQNSIFSVQGTKAGSLGPIAPGRLAHNAYYSQVPPTGGMGAGSDPAPVFLTRVPFDGSPAFASLLAGAGATSNLGFDQAGRPRSTTRMDIGPESASPLVAPSDLRLGLGSAATRPLAPGANSITAPVDRIIAYFDRDADVDLRSLSLIGLDGQTIRIASFQYDPVNRKATWLLQNPLSQGRIRLNLDSQTTLDFRLIMDGLR